jgi:DNA-binding response OmpR family regulator
MRPLLKKYRIMVVDDDEVCSLALREAGFEVATFPDGMMALQNALASSPDVVLTDFSMPKLDGLTLAKELRKHCPACRVLVM